jgi:hypothetical protein
MSPIARRSRANPGLGPPTHPGLHFAGRPAMEKRALLTGPQRIRSVTGSEEQDGVGETLLTRDHDVIRKWADRRGAEPATGEATGSGPATTVTISDTGAGIRFNFPGAGVFRPISWEEWFANFDEHQLAFVYEDSPEAGSNLSGRYRIVRAADVQS